MRELSTWLIALLAAVWVVPRFFAFIDDAMHDDARTALSTHILIGLWSKSIQSTLSAFEESMNAVYGRRLISARVAILSALTTIGFFAFHLIFLIWVPEFLKFGRLPILSRGERTLIQLMVTNLPMDLASLVATRAIFRLVAKRRHMIPPAIIFDLGLSFAFGVAGFVLACWVFGLAPLPLGAGDALWAVAWFARNAWSYGYSFTILFSSSLSSVWLWLLGIGVIILKTAMGTERFARLVNQVFDVEDRPMHALGIVASAIAIVGGVVFKIAKW